MASVNMLTQQMNLLLFPTKLTIVSEIKMLIDLPSTPRANDYSKC